MSRISVPPFLARKIWEFYNNLLNPPSRGGWVVLDPDKEFVYRGSVKLQCNPRKHELIN